MERKQTYRNRINNTETKLKQDLNNVVIYVKIISKSENVEIWYGYGLDKK